jgi:uncharacterized cupredoxin-like copper-binding protein
MRATAGARIVWALAVGLTAVSLSACGDDDEPAPSPTDKGADTPGTGGAQTRLAIDAVEGGQGKLGFSKDALTAKAGTVTVRMRNPSGNQLPHAIEVEGEGLEEEGDTVQAGDASTVTVDLKPGRYEFYCPVDGHEDQGMKGTLTVR